MDSHKSYGSFIIFINSSDKRSLCCCTLVRNLADIFWQTISIGGVPSMTSAALLFGSNLVWSILRLTKAWKVCNFAAFWFDQTGAQYSRIGSISVLYKVVSVFRDRPHLLIHWIRSSLHLFLQRATTSSVWSLKLQALSTIKPRINLLLILHASFPSVKTEVVSPSEFMCIIFAWNHLSEFSMSCTIFRRCWGSSVKFNEELFPQELTQVFANHLRTWTWYLWYL